MGVAIKPTIASEAKVRFDLDDGNTKDEMLKKDIPDAEDNSRQDLLLGFALLFVAAVIRLFRLGIPGAVVFDEYHFGKFVDNILDGKLLFDIHPPLGKLTLAAGGWFLGYRSVEGFGYDSIGKEYGEVLFYALREVAVFFGVLTVPLTFATAKELGATTTGAMLSAMLVCFDNLNIIESRLILMDSQVLFYCCLSLYCALKLWKTQAGTWRRFIWLTLTGIACGCSISIKWTSLATPGLIAIISFFGLHFLDMPLTILECIYAGVTGISIYIFSFYLHFKLMPNDGPGSAFYLDEFKKTLIGHETYDPDAPKQSFWKLFFNLNKVMMTSNMNITTRHHWESYWYQWIVNWRGLLYYNKEVPVGSGNWQSVYLLCNPLVCWFCAICVALFMLGGLAMVRFRGMKFLSGIKGRNLYHSLFTCMFLFWGWILNLLPYILVDRSAFVYHYLPGLLYAQLLSGVIVSELPKRLSFLVTFLVSIGVTAAFIFHAPWIYAYSISSAQHEARRWLPKWN